MVPANRFFDRMRDQIADIRKKTVEEENQKIYLGSGDTPNPRIIPDLTSFIVQYRNISILPLVDFSPRIEEFLSFIQKSEQVVHELEVIQLQSHSDGESSTSESCAHYVGEIRSITAQKMDELLAGMLSQA